MSERVTREELITALRHLHEMCRIWLQCSAVDNAEALLTRIDEETDEEQYTIPSPSPRDEPNGDGQ